MILKQIFNEEDLEKAIACYLRGAGMSVVKTYWRAEEIFDALDRPIGGHSITCEVEVKVTPKE